MKVCTNQYRSDSDYYEQFVSKWVLNSNHTGNVHVLEFHEELLGAPEEAVHRVLNILYPSFTFPQEKIADIVESFDVRSRTPFSKRQRSAFLLDSDEVLPVYLYSVAFVQYVLHVC